MLFIFAVAIVLLIKQSKCTKHWDTFVSHCIQCLCAVLVSYSSQSVSSKPSFPSGSQWWWWNTRQATTSSHASHFAKRPKNSFLLKLSHSKQSSLTIFLQSVLYCTSTIVVPRGSSSLRSVAIASGLALFISWRLSHTGLHISLFQWSPQSSGNRILLWVVEA